MGIASRRSHELNPSDKKQQPRPRTCEELLAALQSLAGPALQVQSGNNWCYKVLASEFCNSELLPLCCPSVAARFEGLQDPYVEGRASCLNVAMQDHAGLESRLWSWPRVLGLRAANRQQDLGAGPEISDAAAPSSLRRYYPRQGPMCFGKRSVVGKRPF